jgi:hypothetical protein
MRHCYDSCRTDVSGVATFDGDKSGLSCTGQRDREAFQVAMRVDLVQRCTPLLPPG